MPLTLVGVPDAPTVAIPVLLLVQVPPDIVFDRLVAEPAHIEDAPEMTAGRAFTVTITFLEHPNGDVYVMRTVLADSPVTTPSELPTVAVLVLLLLHVPLGVVLERVVVEFTHTANVPVILAGKGSTVIGRVIKHPVDSVYVIFTVLAVTPPTTPLDAPTVPTPVLLLLQVPPPGVPLSEVVALIQTDEAPLVPVGSGFTVMTLVM